MLLKLSKNYLEKGMKGDRNKIGYLNSTFTGPTFFEVQFVYFIEFVGGDLG